MPLFPPSDVVMLNRQILRSVDDRLRSELDREKGEWMVKVPISNATRGVWRRYCDVVGVHMGEALAILLHHELASIADIDLETLRGRLEQREAEIEIRITVLNDREGELERREGVVDHKESSLADREQRLELRGGELDGREKALDDRERDLEERQDNVASVEKRITRQASLRQPPATRPRPKLGRNQPCWCDSGKKYKDCHYDQDRQDS